MKMKERYLLLLFLIAASTVFFFYYASTMINAKAKQIKRLDQRIVKAQEQLNSAEVLNKELSGVSRVIRNVMVSNDVEDFDSDEINQFAKKLAAFADSLKIPIQSLTPKEVFSPNKVMQHQFTITLDCTYVQLGQYITSLEKSDRIIKINTIDVKPKRVDEKMKRLQAELGEPDDGLDDVTRYIVTLDLNTFKIRKEA